MADDVANLMDHLNLPQAFIMGYSMGARISAFVCLRHPGRVTSAVFAGLGINMVRGFGNSDTIAAALEAPDLDAIADPVGRNFRIFAEQTKSDLPSLAACIRSARDPITADSLKTIERPVLVAVGTDDPIGGSARELADLIPNGNAFDIAGRDHMKAVGDKSYKQAVLEFFQRTGGVGV